MPYAMKSDLRERKEKETVEVQEKPDDEQRPLEVLSHREKNEGKNRKKWQKRGYDL